MAALYRTCVGARPSAAPRSTVAESETREGTRPDDHCVHGYKADTSPESKGHLGLQPQSLRDPATLFRLAGARDGVAGPSVGAQYCEDSSSEKRKQQGLWGRGDRDVCVGGGGGGGASVGQNRFPSSSAGYIAQMHLGTMVQTQYAESSDDRKLQITFRLRWRPLLALHGRAHRFRQHALNTLPWQGFRPKPYIVDWCPLLVCSILQVLSHRRASRLLTGTGKICVCSRSERGGSI